MLSPWDRIYTLEVQRANFDVGDQATILSDLEGFWVSFVDPSYSLHDGDGSDNRTLSSSSKWTDRCFRDMKLYGKVGTFSSLVEEGEYKLNWASINPRYVVAGNDEVAGGDYVDDVQVDCEDIEN